MSVKNERIAIAMSGGVDSSVAAYLLKQQGHNVIGIFMHFWHDPYLEQAENKCCSLESREDARRVAKKLGIKFYTLNFKNDFKKIIVDNFITQYKNGLTPNPCIRCNQFIKFDLLLKKVKALGCDYLATGHYVKIKRNNEGKNPDFHLHKSQDKTKDQSYFLYQLKQKNLKHLIFPLADYTKDQVKKIAQKNNLIPQSKKESQDVCFVPKNDLAGFLNKYIKQNKLKSGNIIDINSDKILGKHKGLAIYTIGQRGGIGIGGSGPYYVVKKNNKKNILYVTNKKTDKHLYYKELQIKNINWISGQTPKFPLKCKAKSRYGQKEKNVMVGTEYNSVRKLDVKFLKPQRAITPGQSIVFYKGSELLGGGIIKY